MALDAAVVAQMALGKYKAKMAAAFPDVVKGGTVIQIPKEDGTVEYESQEQRGPMEVDEVGILPLLEALAEAVVEHLRGSGTVPGITTGPNTGRIE
jgi:hypothetical protein